MPTATFSPQILNIGTAKLSYYAVGTGPALVIVHGIGGHKEDWQEVARQLAATRTVLAIDMLGFGGSSRDAQDLSISAQADAIKALLDARGIAAADVLGNSVGGWVTATFAAANPQRVNRLIVANPAGFEAMFKGEPPINLFPDNVTQMKKTLSYVIHSDFAHTDTYAEKAFAAFQASGERTIAARLFPAMFSSPKLEQVMPKVAAPTLVIWGREDKLFPVALAPYITSLTPGSKTVVIDQASHFPQIDQPQAFVAAVRAFLP